jgi:hypothetical protein
VEKGDLAMRLDQPAIARVQRATNQKKRIENVTESLHSARRIKPKPKPSNNFKRKIFVKITALSLFPPGRMSSLLEQPFNFLLSHNRNLNLNLFFETNRDWEHFLLPAA